MGLGLEMVLNHLCREAPLGSARCGAITPQESQQRVQVSGRPYNGHNDRDKKQKLVKPHPKCTPEGPLLDKPDGVCMRHQIQ